MLTFVMHTHTHTRMQHILRARVRYAIDANGEFNDNLRSQINTHSWHILLYLLKIRIRHDEWTNFAMLSVYMQQRERQQIGMSTMK